MNISLMTRPLTGKLNNTFSIKTGSTDTDNLVVGYNGNIVMSIWAGYDDNMSEYHD